MDRRLFPPIPPVRATPEEAHGLPNDPGHPSRRMMAHGSMEVRWFVPQPGDLHAPHDRDELYFVVSGSGTFCRTNDADPYDEVRLAVLGEQRTSIGPGDVLFVPAGATHCFEDFTPDFAVWAVFYGPEGGEQT